MQSKKSAAPGRILILVMGIILVVFRGFSFISALLNPASELRNLGGSIYAVVTVITLVAALFIGTNGIIYCSNLKKAKYLRNLGVLYALILIIGNIINHAIYSSLYNEILSLVPVDIIGDIAGSIFVVAVVIGAILALTIPVLFIIGASMNIRAFREHN